jgi:hypothetical protein
MSMTRIQLQAGLSMSMFFQFATEALCAAILEKTLGPQGFSCPHCGDIAPWFVQDRSHTTFQCQACRHQTSLILGALFQSTKLPQTIWFLRINLISQARTGLPALALKRQLGVSYPSAWLFKFKLIQTMAEREAPYPLCGSVQVDDAYLGGELSGGAADGGSENKMFFVAAVSLSDEKHPLPVKLMPVPFISDWAKYNLSSGCAMLSDGLARFGAVTDVDCQHRAISVDRPKPEDLPDFVWINTMLVKLKTSLGGAYHAFDFNKYALRCLAPFPNCFSQRFDHKILRERLLGGSHSYQSPNRCLASFGCILLIRSCHG